MSWRVWDAEKHPITTFGLRSRFWMIFENDERLDRMGDGVSVPPSPDLFVSARDEDGGDHDCQDRLRLAARKVFERLLL